MTPSTTVISTGVGPLNPIMSSVKSVVLMRRVSGPLPPDKLPQEELTIPAENTTETTVKKSNVFFIKTTYSLYKDTFDETVLQPAAGLEIFHSFTLIHDDIMDRSSLRRGVPTVWTKWGEDGAILSGDVMCIDSYRRMAMAPSSVLTKVLDLFSTTAAEVCEGQQYDMDFEKFYTACADFDAWKEAAAADKDNIFPYGDNTAAALAACDALKDKIADYFMRCKLIAFDDSVTGAVDVSADKIVEISGENLSLKAEEIAKYPIARPTKNAVIPLKGGINPAWQGAFDTLKGLVFDVDFPDADSVTEEQWNAVLGKFGPYTAWMGEKKGAEVESLGDKRKKGLSWKRGRRS